MLSATAVAAALCSVAVAASTAGVAVHDPEGFGPHGRLATIGGLTWPSGPEQAGVTGDGRIYVAASPGPSGAPGAVRLRRYLPGGKPDPSFGIAGSLIPAELGSGFRLDQLLVDTNGLAYMVGTTGDGKLVVARLTASGKPDRTYGDDGVASLGSLPPGAPRPRATIDQSSRVIVAGAGVVDRLTPSGDLDQTFGTDGAVPLPSPKVEGLGVDEAGRVQVALPGAEGKGFRLMRLDEDGRPTLRSFGGVGAVRAMAVRSDGSTLILGTASKRTGDGRAVSLLSIGSRDGLPSVQRSTARLRGRGRTSALLSDPNGDDYVIGDREVIDLDIHPRAHFCPGDTLEFFGKNGRIKLTSPGELVALGASITGSGGTLLIDGIVRPRPGSPAHGFLARFRAAEHPITYFPEVPQVKESRCGF